MTLWILDDFTYILNTKFSNGVVHQYDAVLHCHPNVPVHPAAFLGPVLETFILLGNHNKKTVILLKAEYTFTPVSALKGMLLVDILWTSDVCI